MKTTVIRAPITRLGMLMHPEALISEFYQDLSDLNSQAANPMVYLLPKPGDITINRERMEVSATVEYLEKERLRKGIQE